MQKSLFLIAFLIAGCASQPPELPQAAADAEAADVKVFLEEPAIDYKELGRVDMTGRAEHPSDLVEKILRNAARLGANGVIVHSIRHQGRVGRGNDIFGTGGGDGYSVYQVQATAIRYGN